MEALDELVTKQRIVEVLARYCRGIDRMDRAAVASCWHADGTADYGDAYAGTAAGFIDWVWPVHRDGFTAHSHQITNVLVHVHGDRAVSEAYVTVALRTVPAAKGQVDIVSRGRYLDRWSCRDGVWAIDHRRHVADLQTTHPVPPEAAALGATLGRRDRDDPSYELFGPGA